MSEKRQFATHLFWSAASNWSREVINFCIFLALARILGPRTYGIMGMVGIATAIANALLIDGVGNFVVREKTLERGHLDAVFWVQMGVAAVMSLLMIAGSSALARFYGEPQVGQILPVMSVLPPLYALSGVPTAVLQRELRFRPLAIRSFVAAIVGGTVGLGLAFEGAGVWCLVAMAIGQWAATCVVLWTVAPWRPGFSATRSQMRAVLHFGAHAVGVKMLIIVDQQLPRLVIGATLGAVSLGYFTMAWRIIEVLSLLTIVPIGAVMLPTLSAVKGEHLRLRSGVGASMELAAAISFPSYVGLFCVAPILIPVLTGHAWNGTTQILQLFCIFGITWALLSVVDATMVTLGRMGWRTRFNLFSLALLAVPLVFTSRYGLNAIATTMVVREVITCAISLRALAREGLAEAGDLLRRARPLAASAVIMLGAVLGWEKLIESVAVPPVALVSAVAVGAIVYSVAMLSLSRTFTLQVRDLLAAFRKKPIS